jgi:V8-like Glu-specific endopeptidase
MTEGRYTPGSDFGPGPDAYPYTAVCYIETTFPDGNSIRGTGAMVGPNDVLTAGQMLWDAEHGGAAVSVTVSPGLNNGVAPIGSFQGALFNYFMIDTDGDGKITHSESQSDVGIIGLSTNVGAQTGWFGLETHPLHGVNSDPGALTLTGYPVFEVGNGGGPRMLNDYIAVSPAGSANNAGNWTFDFATTGPARGDVLPGDLGAPLWLDGHGSIHNGNNGPYILGVDSTFGWAADVTHTIDTLVAWINGNDYLMHA